jgi:dienelactone hydrolase
VNRIMSEPEPATSPAPATLRRATRLGVALALTLSSACMNRRTVVPMPDAPERSSREIPVSARAPFAYDPASLSVSNHDLAPEGPYDVKHLSFTSFGDNGQPENRMTAKYFLARGSDPGPLVVILPIWGRDGIYPVRKLSKVLRRRSGGSTHVMVLEGPNRLVDVDAMASAPEPEAFRDEAVEIADRCRVTLIDLQRLMDWIEGRPEVDQDRVAIVGFSIGAIFGADLFLLDRRIDFAVIAMGGTGLATILSSDPHRLAPAREQAMSEFGWSIERYETEMNEVFGFLDAPRLAGRQDPERVLLIEAGRDDRIPPDGRDALWEALGRPERILLDYTHRNAFLTMTVLGGNYTTDRIYGFLSNALETR